MLTFEVCLSARPRSIHHSRTRRISTVPLSSNCNHKVRMAWLPIAVSDRFQELPYLKSPTLGLTSARMLIQMSRLVPLVGHWITAIATCRSICPDSFGVRWLVQATAAENFPTPVSACMRYSIRIPVKSIKRWLNCTSVSLATPHGRSTSNTRVRCANIWLRSGYSSPCG